jgi:hypothetical protein
MKEMSDCDLRTSTCDNNACSPAGASETEKPVELVHCHFLAQNAVNLVGTRYGTVLLILLLASLPDTRYSTVLLAV